MDPATLALVTHQLAPLVIAPLASALATAAEKAPAIPYQGETRTGIVLALSVAALALRVALAWATGTLATVDWTEAARLLVEAGTAALVAAGGYALAHRKPVTPF